MPEENSNGIKGWFKKAKTNVDNFVLENKIENTFNTNNEEFSLGIYDENALINCPKQLFGYFDNDGTIVFYGEREIPSCSIIVSIKNHKAYKIISKACLTSIEIECDGVKYIRKGTKFTFDNDVKEVKVIKVEGKTYLYEN